MPDQSSTVEILDSRFADAHFPTAADPSIRLSFGRADAVEDVSVRYRIGSELEWHNLALAKQQTPSTVSWSGVFPRAPGASVRFQVIHGEVRRRVVARGSFTAGQLSNTTLPRTVPSSEALATRLFGEVSHPSGTSRVIRIVRPVVAEAAQPVSVQYEAVSYSFPPAGAPGIGIDHESPRGLVSWQELPLTKEHRRGSAVIVGQLPVTDGEVRYRIFVGTSLVGTYAFTYTEPQPSSENVGSDEPPVVAPAGDSLVEEGAGDPELEGESDAATSALSKRGRFADLGRLACDVRRVARQAFAAEFLAVDERASAADRERSAATLHSMWSEVAAKAQAVGLEALATPPETQDYAAATSWTASVDAALAESADELAVAPVEAALRVDDCAALFPVGLETRSVWEGNCPTKLKIRILPDRILESRHDPSVTPLERRAGDRFSSAWGAAGSAKNARLQAWRTLATEVGIERAAYVAWTAHTNASRVSDAAGGLGRASRLELMPEQFVVRLFLGGETADIRCRPVRLPVISLFDDVESDGEGASPSAASWLTDFDAAVDRGLGVTVDLEAAFPNWDFSRPTTIDTIVVVGLRDTREGELERLLSDHAFAEGGATFLHALSPTNNCDDCDTVYRAADAERLFPAVERLLTQEAAPPDTQAARLADALGVDATSLSWLDGGHARVHNPAGAMLQLLWEATWGKTESRRGVINERYSFRPDKTLREHVRARGPFGALRIGPLPYGFLPTTPRGRAPVTGWRTDLVPRPDDAEGEAICQSMNAVGTEPVLHPVWGVVTRGIVQKHVITASFDGHATIVPIPTRGPLPFDDAVEIDPVQFNADPSLALVNAIDAEAGHVPDTFAFNPGGVDNPGLEGHGFGADTSHEEVAAGAAGLTFGPNTGVSGNPDLSGSDRPIGSDVPVDLIKKGGKPHVVLTKGAPQYSYAYGQPRELKPATEDTSGVTVAAKAEATVMWIDGSSFEQVVRGPEDAAATEFTSSLLYTFARASVYSLCISALEALEPQTNPLLLPQLTLLGAFPEGQQFGWGSLVGNDTPEFPGPSEPTLQRDPAALVSKLREKFLQPRAAEATVESGGDPVREVAPEGRDFFGTEEALHPRSSRVRREVATDTVELGTIPATDPHPKNVLSLLEAAWAMGRSSEHLLPSEKWLLGQLGLIAQPALWETYSLVDNATVSDQGTFTIGAFVEVLRSVTQTARAARFLSAAALGQDELALLTSETLDLAGCRIDAWTTAAATRRLAEVGAGSGKTVMGAYGYIEALTLRPPSAASAGFILAPSVHQAELAAVGYSAFKSGDLGEGVSLSTARLREVQATATQRRAGLTLNEIRTNYLHESLIAEGAQVHWQDVVDEFGVQRDAAVKTPEVLPEVDTAELLREGSTWTATLGTGNASTIAGLNRAIENLRESADAFGDAMVFEGLHHLLQGSAEGAAAANRVAAGMQRPSRLEWFEGPRVHHPVRMGMICSLPQVPWPERWIQTPLGRAAGAPVNAWVASFLGSVDEPIANIKTDQGSLTLRMSDLVVSPVEFVWLASEAAGGAPAGLTALFVAHAGAAATSVEVTTAARLSVVLPICQALAATLKAEPLVPAHLQTGTAASGLRIDVVDLVERAVAALEDVAGIADDLEGADPELASVVAAWRFVGSSAGELDTAAAATRDAVREALAAAGAESVDDVPAAIATFKAELEALTNEIASVLEAETAEKLTRLVHERVSTVLAALFGKSFPLIPKLTMDGATLDWWSKAVATAPSESDLNQWVHQSARTIGRVADWELAALLADVAFETTHSLQVSVVQDRWKGGWVGGPVDLSDRAEVPGNITSYVVAGAKLSVGAVSGLRLGEWPEAIPVRDIRAGIACHVDTPSNVAPHAVLLAVHERPDPEVEGAEVVTHWGLDELFATVKNTMDLAKVRMVDIPALDRPMGFPMTLLDPAVTAGIAVDDPAEGSAKGTWVWDRLQLSARRRDNSRESQAWRVHDPLWMLGRQWQYREFDGDDAASVVRAEVAVRHHPVDERPLLSGSGRPVDGRAPLEALVEAEPLAWDVRTRLWAGLEARRRGAPVSKLGFFDGELSARGELLADYASQVSIPDPLTLHEVDSEMRAVVDSAYVHQDGGLWDETTAKYSVGISIQDRVLRTECYENGNLDWTSFDWVGGKLPSAGFHEVTSSPLVTSLQIAGAPVERLWEMEQGHANFHRTTVGGQDLATLSLLNFVHMFSNDYAVFPVKAELGSVIEVSKLVLSTSFGDEISVGPVPDSCWSVFEMTHAKTGDGVPNVLYLPNRVVGRIESRPIEEVEFRRSEADNLVWAVQHRVPDAAGLPADGQDLALRRRLAAAAPLREAAEESVAQWKAAADSLDAARDAVSATTRRLIQAAESDRAALREELELGKAAREVAEEVEGQARANALTQLQLLELAGGDRRQIPDAPRRATNRDAKYQLWGRVPEHHVPLVPELRAEDGLMRLRRQALPDVREILASGDVKRLGFWARVLGSPDRPFYMNPSAVPQQGAVVRRTYQLARDADGNRYLWLGRDKTVWQPKTQIENLEFDSVDRK